MITIQGYDKYFVCLFIFRICCIFKKINLGKNNLLFSCHLISGCASFQ